MTEFDDILREAYRKGYQARADEKDFMPGDALDGTSDDWLQQLAKAFDAGWIARAEQGKPTYSDGRHEKQAPTPPPASWNPYREV